MRVMGEDRVEERKYGVAIYGATPAGIVAAIAAAREGAEVCLLEPGRFIGGMVAGGLCRTDYGKPETVGGITREYFERCSRHYGGRHQWYLEPHVFENTFADMLAECGVKANTGQRLRRVERTGSSLTAIELDNGCRIEALAFIDCTYEGDLMAAAGVPYRVGREAGAEYGESLAGYQPLNPNTLHDVSPVTGEFLGDVCACLDGPAGVHYVRPTPFRVAFDRSGRPLPGVHASDEDRLPGSGDGLTQAYNFRLTVTRDPHNRVPFPKPQRYDAERYDLLLDYIDRWPMIRLARLVHFGKLTNGKYDVNSNGPFSTDYVGGNAGYPEGSRESRAAIWQDHIDYVQGLFWFLSHDPRVPERLREETNEWGLCRDEFVRNDNWPYQLYIRECRRMKGAYVMTERDVTVDRTKPDAVAVGSFLIDSHAVQRVIRRDGTVMNEGGLDVRVRPYEIPYRSLLPDSGNVSNLLVPVCLSASHVAYCSLRMEPVYMMLGHAAGVAAAMAEQRNASVRDADTELLRQTLMRQGQIVEWRT